MIEKPTPSTKAYRTSLFPFSHMKVGDSFDCDPEDVKSMRNSASNFGRRHGQRFIVRAQPDGTAICWRVE